MKKIITFIKNRIITGLIVLLPIIIIGVVLADSIKKLMTITEPLTKKIAYGGWALYMKEGKPEFTYNFLGLDRHIVKAPEKLPIGPVELKLDFKYDGDGAGKGGMATMYVNGKEVASGRIEKTQPLVFSADETADVGLDNQTPVALGIGYGPEETKFTEKINKIVVEIE